MPRYFKLVCLHDDPQWYLEEFRQGRARYGWSGPGSNLRSIKARIDAGEWKNRTDDEVQAWSYTQFLIERVGIGDRVVVQTEQPIRTFLIGEVIPPGYEFSPGDLDDFNHVLHITPITREADTAVIPASVDLFKKSLRSIISPYLPATHLTAL